MLKRAQAPGPRCRAASSLKTQASASRRPSADALKQGHSVARAMDDHPFIAAIVGDDGIIGHGALVGQHTTDRPPGRVRRFAMSLCGEMVQAPPCASAPTHEDLLQGRHVEHAGLFAHRVMFIVRIAADRSRRCPFRSSLPRPEPSAVWREARAEVRLSSSVIVDLPSCLVPFVGHRRFALVP